MLLYKLVLCFTIVMSSGLQRRDSTECYGLTRIIKLLRQTDLSYRDLSGFLSIAASYSSVRVMKAVIGHENFDKSKDYTTSIIASANVCNSTVTEFLVENIPNLRTDKTWSLIKSLWKHCEASFAAEFLPQLIERYKPLFLQH